MVPHFGPTVKAPKCRPLAPWPPGALAPWAPGHLGTWGQACAHKLARVSWALGQKIMGPRTLGPGPGILLFYVVILQH